MKTDRLLLRLQKFINEIEKGGDLERYGYGEVYRASMLAEKQKFLDTEKAGDLLVDNKPELRANERKEIAEEAGFTFSKTEDRAYNAVQKLLDGGKAKQDGRRYSSAFHGKYDSFDIEVNYSDYYEAFGLTRTNGSFTGNQVALAKDALFSLREERRILYERKDGGEKQFVNTRKPLVSIDKEDSGISIKPSPLFIDQLDSFHLFKPVQLHEEIKEWRGEGLNYPRSVPNFIQWLNTVNLFPMEIDKGNLVRKIGLASYKERSQYQRMDEYLSHSLKAATGLDFLLDWQLEGNKYRFYLNPLRCSRYRYRLKEREGERERFADFLEEYRSKQESRGESRNLDSKYVFTSGG